MDRSFWSGYAFWESQEASRFFRRHRYLRLSFPGMPFGSFFKQNTWFHGFRGGFFSGYRDRSVICGYGAFRQTADSPDVVYGCFPGTENTFQKNENMIDVKKILFPCDLAENAAKILPYLLSIREKYLARIYLLFVVEDLPLFHPIPQVSISLP